MSRRAALASLAGAATLWLPGCGRASAQDRLFTPEMFGARGDGRADDYEALQRLIAAVNAAGGGTVRFGRNRRYLIDRYVIVDGPRRNGVAHLVFRRCQGLHLDLNGSTIDVKGDFHRPRDVAERRLSWSSQVIPLAFNRCADVTVENGELNGHVDRMSRDRGVREIGGGLGISLLGCERVRLEALNVHHFSVDGVRAGISRLGGEEVPCRNVELRGLRLANNARQAFTNAGGSAVTATDCLFIETGITGGAYPRHGPSAGVDVEPTRELSPKSDFTARRCRFDDNLGAPFVAGNPDRTGLIELIDCAGRAGSERTIQRRLILTAERTVIRDGTWRNVQIACAYGARRRFDSGISIEVSGGHWSGDDPEWAPVYDLNRKRPRVHIHDNRFELVSPRPFASTSLFQCANRNHRFENNEIFVAAGGHDGEGDDLVGDFRGASLVAGNRWTTDARPPLRFVNDYTGARTEGEVFAGAFAAMRRG